MTMIIAALVCFPFIAAGLFCLAACRRAKREDEMFSWLDGER